MKRFYSEEVNRLTLLVFLKLMVENRTSLSRSGDQDSEENSDDAQEEASEETSSSDDTDSGEEGQTRGIVDPARTRVVDPARTGLVDPARTR